MEMELDQLVTLAEQGNAATADIGLYGMAVINDAELRRPVAEFDRRLIDADAVADVVSTGTTLRQAGLEIFGPVLLESEAVLIGAPVEADGTETLLRRLRGVMVARRYVLIDYDLPADLVDKAVALAPGIESPTISPLRDPAWVAVRVMSPRKTVNQVMDALYAIGARAILVTPIHNARL